MKGGLEKIPKFYSTSDCTGIIDPGSKQWSMNAKDGVAVRPFSTKGAYLQGWAINKCLTIAAYSVNLMIDETACASNNTANQFVLNYYTGSTTCGGAPTLTLDQCVTYARSSVKVVTEVSVEDLCIGTDYFVKKAAGRTKTRIWESPTCTGPLCAAAHRMRTRNAERSLCAMGAALSMRIAQWRRT